jgi:hypothetical protein
LIFMGLAARQLHELSLEEKPALRFVAEASLLRGGRGDFPADLIGVSSTFDVRR